MLDDDDDVALRAAVVDGVDVHPLLVVPTGDAVDDSSCWCVPNVEHDGTAVLPEQLTVDDLGPLEVGHGRGARRRAAPVHSQIESPGPSDSESLVAVGSGLSKRSLNSTSVERAAEAVTYTSKSALAASFTE